MINGSNVFGKTLRIGLLYNRRLKSEETRRTALKFLESINLSVSSSTSFISRLIGTYSPFYIHWQNSAFALF